MGPETIAERIAGGAAGTSVLTAVGFSIATVNEYLQAGAFIVSMIAGLAATFYYIRKLPK
jgi:hypothetical protein